jgi:hypothetical protein
MDSKSDSTTVADAAAWLERRKPNSVAFVDTTGTKRSRTQSKTSQLTTSRVTGQMARTGSVSGNGVYRELTSIVLTSLTECAQTIRVTMRPMGRGQLAAVLCGAFALLSCSVPANTQRATDAGKLSLKARIPRPDVNAYRSVLDARNWQNPYLTVGREGVSARPISAATEAPIMQPSEVVQYLEKLPSIAWPYGLVVAVQENGLRAPGDDAPIKKNREELVRLLQKEGIKVELWPSA